MELVRSHRGDGRDGCLAPQKKEVDVDSTKVLCVKWMDSTYDEGEPCATSKSCHTVLSGFEDQLLCNGRASEICVWKHLRNGLYVRQGNRQQTQFLGLMATELFTWKLVEDGSQHSRTTAESQQLQVL